MVVGRRWTRCLLAAITIAAAVLVLVNLSSGTAHDIATNAAHPLPTLTGPVVDDAALLPAWRRARLANRLRELRSRSGHQMIVVTLPSLHGERIEDVGLRVGNGWGIGDKYLDNGVLLIVAPTEQQVRIEVGRGVEGRIPDARAAAIIKEAILPAFARGAMADGIERGTDAIIAALS
jgi:uncharacterized protein